MERKGAYGKLLMPEGIMSAERVAMLLSILLYSATIRETGLSRVRFSRISLAVILRPCVVPERAEVLARLGEMRARSVDRRAKAEGTAFTPRDSREDASGPKVDGPAFLKAVIDKKIDLRSAECGRCQTGEYDDREEG